MNAGFGVIFKRGDGGGSEVFTAIADVVDVSIPGISRSTIDVSDHSSTAKYAEVIGGLRDAGELGVTINFGVATTAHTDLLTDLETDAARNYQIVFPDTAATTWQISGLVTAFEVSAPRDGVITAQITIKVSGQPNFSV